MDPFDQLRRRRINWEAIAAFVIAVIVAYVVQFVFRFGGGNLFTVLIVLAVGGFWYHLRRIV